MTTTEPNFILIILKGKLREGDNKHIIFDEYDSVIPLLNGVEDAPSIYINYNSQIDLTEYLIEHLSGNQHAVIKQVRFDNLNECLNPVNVIQSSSDYNDTDYLLGKYKRRRVIYDDCIEQLSSKDSKELTSIINSIYNPFFSEDYVYSEIYVYSEEQNHEIG